MPEHWGAMLRRAVGSMSMRHLALDPLSGRNGLELVHKPKFSMSLVQFGASEPEGTFPKYLTDLCLVWFSCSGHLNLTAEGDGSTADLLG